MAAGNFQSMKHLELLKLCPNVIRKVRYIVYHKGNKWEIDEFLGDNEGLTIAECELTQATLNPELPDFCLETKSQKIQGIITIILHLNPYLKLGR